MASSVGMTDSDGGGEPARLVLDPAPCWVLRVIGRLRTRNLLHASAEWQRIEGRSWLALLCASKLSAAGASRCISNRAGAVH